MATKLEERWRLIRETNEPLWEAVVALAYEAKDRRRFPYWSMDALFHVLRWQNPGVTTGDHGLRLNNNYTAYAVRDLIAEHPEFEGFFRLRQQKPRGNFGQIH